MKNRVKIKFDPFLFVLIIYFLVVIAVNFWTLVFDDHIAMGYGWLMFIFSSHDNTSLEIAYAKIVLFSLLCTTPILFIKIISYFKPVVLKVFLYIFAGIMIVGLIVLFYVLSKDVFKSIPRSTRTMDDLFLNMFFGWIIRLSDDIKNIYAWFLTPIVYVAFSVIITIVFINAKFSRWVQAAIFVFAGFPLFLVMPLVIMLLGGIVSIIIELLLFLMVGGVIIGFIVAGASPDKKYVTSDGTVLNSYGGSLYDSNGNRWKSDDGNNTAYKE